MAQTKPDVIYRNGRIVLGMNGGREVYIDELTDDEIQQLPRETRKAITALLRVHADTIDNL